MPMEAACSFTREGAASLLWAISSEEPSVRAVLIWFDISWFSMAVATVAELSETRATHRSVNVKIRIAATLPTNPIREELR